ncbi:hypothetical protein PF005_g16472 [Phytophthora fragariae]|uniref:M96 mating-specific protein family n=2 Tax=Phytophthora TaxID=4783 RepID=A0A6A3MAK3_9STRA|nr:hypothetical protein PF003_g33797 [Phytophthora fragariae]KAE9042931.1 hypothetical protein PR002_g3622 [Phytophthora rubi]KAE8946295.1 hypothetical protein PF009_g4072 [Phytophthora fragariae]KAE9029281.1 hypothetical protein PF011_g1158 [Phytophthora fragariae]KAE9049225.1 hypothetical protein PR001_g3521 [Phytophthora rubi]
MAFLEGLDDARVLEAALGFVDDYVLDLSAASNAPTAVESMVQVEPPAPHNASSRSVSNGAPSFSIDCTETARMVPFQNTQKLRINAKFADFERSLLPSRGELKTPRHKKTNPNRARDEAQFEVVYLREKVTELETKLRLLHLQVVPIVHAADTPPAQVSSLAQIPRVWEEVARRQRRHREQAEHENARLKVILERKQKMLVGLCEILQRRLIHQNVEHFRMTGLQAPEQQSVRVLDYHGDIRDFQDLFRRLEAAYDEQGRVFTVNGLSGVQFPTDIVQVREVSDNQIEVCASKLLPFCLHDVGEAAWDHFKGVEKHLGNGGLYGKSMKNLDQPFTIIEDFTKEVFSKNLRADVQAKQIVRRYMDADRDMILFVSSMTPTEIKHKAVSGLVYHGQEYALTKLLPDAAVAGQELSLLQLCTRVSIECEPGVKFDARSLRSVARFWIGNIAGNLRCYQERIENALVDQAVRRQTAITH